MRTRTWCVAVSLLSIGATASSQTVLSEADALARLSADSPRVRAIRAGVDVARADALAAGRWPNPRVTLNRESVSGIGENMVTVTQPLPISGRRGFDMLAARARTAASASRADEEIRRARAELRLAYADLVSAQIREQALGQSRDRLRDLAQTLARREAAGESAGYDRLRAEREVADLESAWADARASRADAQGAVAGFFAAGVDPSSVVAAPPSSTRTPLPGVDDLISRADTARGDYAALKHEVEAAGLAMRSAERRVIPDPEVVAGTKSSTAAGGDVGSVVSVHVALPLFDRARPERALAQARQAQAAALADALHASMQAQIAAARAVVVERRDAADRYRASTADTTARLERIAQVSYDAGERGILELLDAYRAGASARTRQADLDAAARQAEVELEFLSGWEMQ